MNSGIDRLFDMFDKKECPTAGNNDSPDLSRYKSERINTPRNNYAAATGQRYAASGTNPAAKSQNIWSGPHNAGSAGGNPLNNTSAGPANGKSVNYGSVFGQLFDAAIDIIRSGLKPYNKNNPLAEENILPGIVLGTAIASVADITVGKRVMAAALISGTYALGKKMSCEINDE